MLDEKEQIKRLQNILLHFLDEVTKFGNTHNIDTTVFSTIPILIEEREDLVEKLRKENQKPRQSKYNEMKSDLEASINAQESLQEYIKALQNKMQTLEDYISAQNGKMEAMQKCIDGYESIVKKYTTVGEDKTGC
ncbi:MAG: hypothetical protein UGF89_06465 [Acutalibacteraceae bacterium]|nr:hypothetical protein [Acutalibacteraceae bacterium]